MVGGGLHSAQLQLSLHATPKAMFSLGMCTGSDKNGLYT
jgi:hypothetical protein